MTTIAHRQIQSFKQYLEFPSEIISQDRHALEWLARLFWLAIPLEYFILTRIPGGPAKRDLLPTLAAAVLCVAGILLLSGLLAFAGGAKEFKRRFQARAVSFLANWAFTVALLAASYFATFLANLPGDLVATVVCPHLAYFQYPMFSCDGYPYVWGLATYGIYFAYALMSAIVLSILVRHLFIMPDAKRNNVKPLNIFGVAAVTAIATGFVHGIVPL
ncbi:MAG TPA: hypothetical protein VIJ52_00410 [Pseudolabrys sp.]